MKKLIIGILILALLFAGCGDKYSYREVYESLQNYEAKLSALVDKGQGESEQAEFYRRAIASLQGGLDKLEREGKKEYIGPEIIYEITGSATRVNVTLYNASGGTEQYTNVYLPHRYEYFWFPGDFLYISAQNQGEYGTVTVRIYWNNHLVKESFSSGAYVIASASGRK
ncbi:hypothetical protein ES708_30277 [subsurface metagenome]